MESENPYRPPQGDALEDIVSKIKTQQPVYETRWQATRAGMRRGAVLGMRVSAGLIVVMLLMTIYVMIKRSETFFQYSDGFLNIVVEITKLVGSFLGTCVLATVYCAIPGGIIMGLIESIRFRKPK